MEACRRAGESGEGREVVMARLEVTQRAMLRADLDGNGLRRAGHVAGLRRWLLPILARVRAGVGLGGLGGVGDEQAEVARAWTAGALGG